MISSAFRAGPFEFATTSKFATGTSCQVCHGQQDNLDALQNNLNEGCEKSREGIGPELAVIEPRSGGYEVQPGAQAPGVKQKESESRKGRQ